MPTNTSKLLREAWGDLKKGGAILSTFPRALIMGYVDRIAVLTSVYLVAKLTWETLDNIQDYQLRVSAAVFALFQVQVFWINVHHFLKFSSASINIFQVWLLLIFSSGFIFYIITLEGWIDGDDSSHHFIMNTIMSAVMTALCFSLKIEGANALYRVYHKVAPCAILVWYLVATILCSIKSLGEDAAGWMTWCAPFFFIIPLGGPKTIGGKKESDDELGSTQMLHSHDGTIQIERDGVFLHGHA